MKSVKPFESAKLPSPLLSAARILLLRRAGLTDPSTMPQIERHANDVTLNPAWLRQYGDCIGVGIADMHQHGLPPLTLQMAAAALHLSIISDPVFPFKAMGLVHLSQTVIQHRKVNPSMRLNLQAMTTDAREEKRGISFGLVTEAREDGQLIWRSELRALSISRRREEAKRMPAQTVDAYADLECMVTEGIEVPENMGRRFARIAGDRNPIHQHAWLARPFGFRRAIVHGTWTLARALAKVGLPLTDTFRLHASFQRPVELPSQIVAHHYQRSGTEQRVLRVVNSDGVKTHITVEVTKT